MEKYDGSTDHVDHLRALVDLMRLRATPDVIMFVVFAMMNRTRSHPFKMSLSKNPPDTMHELLRRGDKYVDAEEAFFITKGMKDRKEPESNKKRSGMNQGPEKTKVNKNDPSRP
ncbi:Uncharacterized protein Adt_39886 [Abeliophyllum distichum]|uniref:Uncharacterized protein n=1 Tax=Abeliophyllum distichum TaxID=126358 RepID=A0ABD1Q6C7_9LAMI